VDCVALALAVTVTGEKAQVIWLGRLGQERVTFPVKPLIPVIVATTPTELPCATEVDLAREKEKSGVPLWGGSSAATLKAADDELVPKLALPLYIAETEYVPANTVADTLVAPLLSCPTRV
jgi:hypothetical protein